MKDGFHYKWSKPKENSKFSKEENYSIWSFPMPPGVSCPGAGICSTYCYGTKRNYKRQCVINCYKTQWEKVITDVNLDTFTDNLNQDIALLPNSVDAIRIHPVGDFYCQRYADNWLSAIRSNSDMQFYAYTKSLHYFDWDNLPANFWLIQSLGGKFDADIRPEYPIAKIFACVSDLLLEGYTNCQDSDRAAIGCNRVGLIAH